MRLSVFAKCEEVKYTGSDFLKRLLPAAKAGSSFSCSFFPTVAQCEEVQYTQWVPRILRQNKLNVHLCAINHDDILTVTRLQSSGVYGLS